MDLPADYMRNARNSPVISSVKNIRYVKRVPYLDFIHKKIQAPISLPLHTPFMKSIKKCGEEFPRLILNGKYNDYIKRVCKLAGLEDEVQETMAEVISVKRGYRMLSVTRKKHETLSK